MRNLLFCFLFILTSLSFAAEIAVISTSKSKVPKLIADHFKAEVEKEGHTVHSFKLLKNQDFTHLVEPLRSLGITHLFAIGRQSAEVARDLSIPGVFTMVIRPEKADLLASSGHPLHKMTGVFTCPGIHQQLAFLKEFLAFKRVGLVYNPDYSNFSVILHNIYYHDNEVDILELPQTKRKSVLSTFDKNKNSVDAFISVLDLFTYNAKTLPTIIRFSIINRVPFIGFTQNIAELGALASLYCDYPSLSKQAAKLMLELIKNEEETLGNPAEYPKKLRFSINLKTANILGIKIPPHLQDEADKIFE